MASDSEDDKPIIARARPVANGAGAPPPTKKIAAQQQAPDEDSDEDVPLAQKLKQSQQAAKNTELSAKPDGVKPQQPAGKAKPAAKKKGAAAAVKEAAAAAGGTDTEGTEGPGKAVRVKKEYDLPGQTRETPAETDPLRKFYTSLLEQIPESEMAKKWCCMHGLLDAADAEAFLHEQAAKKGITLRSPTKGSPAPRKPRAKSDDSERPKSRAAGGKAGPKRAAASSGGGPRKRGRARDESEDEADETSTSSGQDSDDEPIAKRKPAAKKAPAAKATNGAAKSASAKTQGQRRPATKRDRPFTDGGLDESGSDGDDDVPIARRLKTEQGAKPVQASKHVEGNGGGATAPPLEPPATTTDVAASAPPQQPSSAPPPTAGPPAPKVPAAPAPPPSASQLAPVPQVQASPPAGEDSEDDMPLVIKRN